MGLTPLYVSKLFHLYWCNSLSVWSKLQANILIFGLVMVEIWPAVCTSTLQPVYPITSRKILRQEVPSQMCQSCSIFISATPSIIGPSCSIIAQYFAWPGRQNGALPTWVYWSQTTPLQVPEQCDMGLTPLYVSKLFHLYWCNSLSVWSKLQANILIFGLVMVEIWPAVCTSTLQPVYPITSRKILRQEVPSQMCQSCSIFISATPSIIGPSCSIIAQYFAWPGRQNGALPTWVYWSQTTPLQVPEQCDMGLTPLYVSKLFHLYWCNSLGVWSKLQNNILIFGLLMVEIWYAIYTSSLEPVYPITSRKILRQEFPSQM